MKIRLIAVFTLFLILLPRLCFASLPPIVDFQDAWEKCSIVVLGSPRLVEDLSQAMASHSATYVMEIEKSFKGEQTKGAITFVDSNFRTSADLPISVGEKYLVFVQTAQDREKSSHSNSEDVADNVQSGLWAFWVNDTNINQIESAVKMLVEYNSVAEGDKNRYLLNMLPMHSWYSNFVVKEIINRKVVEAIPYFEREFIQTKDEEKKLSILAILGGFDQAGAKAKLLSCLAGESVKNKAQLVHGLGSYQDKSDAPEIRKYIHDKDEYVAVAARSVLLQYGEPDAKDLLFDIIHKSGNSTVRYNAIHVLHWNYSGAFTEEEKAQVRNLKNDTDEGIARVAGFIVEKW